MNSDQDHNQAEGMGESRPHESERMVSKKVLCLLWVPKMLHMDDSKGEQKYVNVKHLMTYLISSIYVRSQRKLGEQTPATTLTVMRHRSLRKLPGSTLAKCKAECQYWFEELNKSLGEGSLAKALALQAWGLELSPPGTHKNARWARSISVIPTFKSQDSLEQVS